MQSPQYISLIQPAPPGFEVIDILKPPDWLIGPVAILVSSVDQFVEEQKSLLPSACALIIEYSDSMTFSMLHKTAWRIGLQKGAQNLRELVDFWMSPLSTIRNLQDDASLAMNRFDHLKRELEYARDFAHRSHNALLAQREEESEWSARALTMLVSWLSSSVPELDIDKVDAAFLQFLASGPFELQDIQFFAESESRGLEPLAGLRDQPVEVSLRPFPTETQVDGHVLWVVGEQHQFRRCLMLRKRPQADAFEEHEVLFYQLFAHQLCVAIQTRKLQSELSDSLRAKDRFLANISHELRTPLNAIIGHTQLLLEERQDLNDEQALSMDEIGEAGQHLLGLVNDLLDLNQVENGALEFEEVPIELGELCRTCVAMMAAPAKSRGLELQPPATEERIWVTGDPLRMRQVLLNLLGNAMKFTSEGGLVWLRIGRESGRAYFAVRDTGIGIPEGELPHIFDRFRKVGQENRKAAEGAGLGLSLVKQFVERQNGDILVTSLMGHGSVFKVLFDEISAPGQSLETGVEPESALRIVRSQARILCAEDNPANQRLITIILEKSGYEVVMAQNGLEALDLLAESRPDLVLMDINMPKMDGLEATQKIRQNPLYSDIPVIALTGAATESERASCLNAGCDAFLSKPLDMTLLRNLLVEYLGRADAKQIS